MLARSSRVPTSSHISLNNAQNEKPPHGTAARRVSELVLLVDSTLIDNDRVKADLQTRIHQLVDPARGAASGCSIERSGASRTTLIPAHVERFRAAWPDERRFPQLASQLLCCPYERCCLRALWMPSLTQDV